MKNNKKGFTLAELLVVVAIIAVLVAIAIPVFSAATDKAQQAVYQANARSAYAEAMVNVLSDNKDYSTTAFEKKYDDVTYSVKVTTAGVGTVTVGASDAKPASYTFGE